MKKLSFLVSVIVLLAVSNAQAQGSVSATYTAGNIPTSEAVFDSTCNGNNIILSVTLPAGESYPVTGVNISYNMTALAGGQMAHQRSQVKCVTTNNTEAAVYSGVGTTGGTFNYSRTGVTIANGTYAGGTQLNFEMHAWRVTGAPSGPCNTVANRVDANSWTITVYYGAQNISPKVGVNTTSPGQTLDVIGKLKLGNDIVPPTAGTVRWNSDTKDFEGFDGTQWLSFTNKGETGGWGGDIIPQTVVCGNDGEDFIGLGTNNNYNTGGVRIDGDYALISAPGANKVYVFFYNNNTWNYQATLVPAEPANNLVGFGLSMSISGDYAVIGNPMYDATVSGGPIATERGKAYVFVRSGTTWTEQTSLNPSDGVLNDRFGASVSISGEYAVVSSPQKGLAIFGDFRGKAYIFKRTGTSWVQQQAITASNPEDNDMFGASVRISGTYIAVGTPSKDIAGKADQGCVYLFNRSGSSWTQQAILTDIDGISGQQFGSGIDLNNNDLVIGTVTTSKIFIYNRVASVWSLQAVIKPGLTDVGSSTVVGGIISNDYLLVGFRGKTIGANANQGKAYVYKRTGTTWNWQTTLISCDGAADDGFGAVGISGNKIIIGATGKDVYNPATNTTYTNSGKIYFFYRQ